MLPTGELLTSRALPTVRHFSGKLWGYLIKALIIGNYHSEAKTSALSTAPTQILLMVIDLCSEIYAILV